LKNLSVAIVTCMLFSMAAVGQSDKADDVSRWKTFSNRAGWSIKYPPNWKVYSCHSCPDPTDPNVFVAFDNPKTEEIVMIQHFKDKPSDQSIERWLDHIKMATNLNPKVGEEWVTLGGARSLKVVTSNHDSTECENFYVVHGSKTFAVQIDRGTPSYQLYQQMLSTFKFTN
jgi:hypothetical protein